jgi:hypothetical protein
MRGATVVSTRQAVLPLIGYSLLAMLVAFRPQASWVVVMLGSPLVLVAFAVSRRSEEVLTLAKE